MGGMITATVLAIFFVPVFFVVVQRVFSAKLPLPGEKKQTDLTVYVEKEI